MLGATARILLGIAVAAGCVSITSHGGQARDHVSFVDNLRSRGLRVEPIGEARMSPLDVPATGLAVSGGALRGRAPILSFDYNDADLGRDGRLVAEEDAMEIARDIRSVRMEGGGVSLPSGPTHFYRRERVIVMYIGADSEVLRILGELFGPQFAGAR